MKVIARINLKHANVVFAELSRTLHVPDNTLPLLQKGNYFWALEGKSSSMAKYGVGEEFWIDNVCLSKESGRFQVIVHISDHEIDSLFTDANVSSEKAKTLVLDEYKNYGWL